MFNELCKKWFSGDNKAYLHTVIDVSGDQADSNETNTTVTLPLTAIVCSQKEKRQCIELGFVHKLIELWKLRKRILENKTEITVTGILSRYNHDAGKAIMNKTVNFRSTYVAQLFKSRNKALTMEEKSRAAIAMYNNEIVLYKALLLQCERDFDLMINVKLYQEIVIPNFTLRQANLLQLL